MFERRKEETSMNKKTKVAIVILVIALIIVVAIAVVALINPFSEKETGTEALNDIQVNEEINNTETNNVENSEQENNVVNEEVNNNTENVTNTDEQQQQPSTSDNANNSNEEKAIELVKNEWGEDDSVYFDLAGVTSDGKYRVSVNKDTRVLAWYIVDIENETVTQK